MMTLKHSIKEAVRTVAPRRALSYYRFVRLARQARLLDRSAPPGTEPAACCDLLWQSADFRPIQRKSEIERLVEIVASLRPATVCEIGAAGGGTLFLFTRAAAPEATLVTVDVQFDPARKAALRSFARDGQEVVCLEGDSHSRETLRAVEDSFAGRPLDLLFIDGDHSYEGVSADFQLYSPLVRRGGLVVFHDIVPDYRTRYGLKTRTDAGGVPLFWSEVKAAHAAVEEIVEDAGQDGYGIGVLRWEG